MKQLILQNAFLAEAANLLDEGCTVRVRIGGESMFPFIRGGEDEVEIVPFVPGQSLPLWSCLFYQWRGRYMVHRYIGRNGDNYCMMGDGNLVQVEEVSAADIKGVLKSIYHRDGTCQDCLDKQWLTKGKRWYRWRKFRRFLIPLIRITMPQRN